MNKYKSQLTHFRRRWSQRIGDGASKHANEQISALIRGGKSTCIKKQSNRVSVHYIEYNGQTLRVVYDKVRKLCITVIPTGGVSC